MPWNMCYTFLWFNEIHGDLRRFIEKSELTWPKRVEILSKIAKSLNALHELDIVHRDFHCGNILVDEDTKIFITNFGLASSANSSKMDEYEEMYEKMIRHLQPPCAMPRSIPREEFWNPPSDSESNDSKYGDSKNSLKKEEEPHDTYAKSLEDDYFNYLMSNKVVEKNEKFKHYKKPDRIWLSDVYRISNSTKDTSGVYLEMQYPQAEISFEKEQIGTFSKLYTMAIESLKNHNSHYELMKIFETYGHFLPKRIIVGYKLYRMTPLITKDSLELSTPEIDFSVKDFTKCDNILNKWECCITPHFDATYLVSVDGETIMRNELDMWMTGCLKNTRTFGVKEKVPITGIIPIEDCAYQYRVKFPVNFKSNNYQIFGKLVKSDGEPISEVVIKFKSTNKYGFSANIKNFEITEFMRLQINWILIGIPAEVGFFSTNTRDINIIAFDSILITPITNGNNWDPNFIATFKSYDDEKREVRVNVYDPGFTNRTNEENFGNENFGNENFGSKQKSIQWCILIPPENQEFIKADIGSSFSINLKHQ
ncbi:15072_t:CDS:10 [Dentiscutata heterogama]|uniref:15072_t:CDS:1 n=1 Tax=Dentiscutata heterogama TaxID=1316150 RepID=A0ACA9KL90_9GLOM|nr:15072_t:CDS:10 [Dentiscutata heterogama]